MRTESFQKESIIAYLDVVVTLHNLHCHQCDQMLKIKSSPNLSKVPTSDFALKLCFHFSPKSHHTFWLLSTKSCLKEISKIAQSGHTGYHDSDIFLHENYTSSFL